ncbi:MAG: sodium:solute symporter, partial [Verrucomicrobia bacterium]|nr:sodium:solute symporter [Verrucomicrobiota bacterium]
LGMFIACAFLIAYITDHLSLGKGIEFVGAMGKMEIIDWKFDPSSRYNIWSGIIGGLFLQLSYFGTDQSQVQRYLGGKSMKESRLGLMFNGLLKIPMQFFILFVGVLVFLFYQFVLPPLHFNRENVQKVEQSSLYPDYQRLEQEQKRLWQEKQTLFEHYKDTPIDDGVKTVLAEIHESEKALMEESKSIIKKVDPNAETQDDDYIFITFVINYLPIGIVGLLLAVIFSAAMSSTSAELNALASTTTVDIYKRNINGKGSELHYLQRSKLFTLLFGLFAIAFAAAASLFDNLIEAVNILGSLFYGTILGIFLVAFFFKKIQAKAVFPAALIAQACIIVLYSLNRLDIIDLGYLWYNLIAPMLVIGVALLLQQLRPNTQIKSEEINA